MPGVVSPKPPSAGSGRVASATDYLAYLYLLRVQLIALLLLIALPLTALPHGAPLGPLLRGIFDVSGTSILRTAVGFTLISFASLMLGMTIGLTARLVLLNGHERFGVGKIPAERGVELAVRLVPLLAALGVIVGVCFQTWPVIDVCHVLAGASGIVAAVVVLRWLVPWIHEFVWHDKTHPPRAPRALRLPFDAAADVYERVGRKSPAGYFKPTAEFRPAHVFASHQLVLSLTAYALLWFFKRVVALSDPLGDQQPVVPTLCLLLVLMMLTCWALSAVTFLADRFRMPVLFPVIAYFGVMSAFPQGDYFYPSHEPKRVERRRSPAEVIERHAGEPMVVVAAAGGGIHAAAWTARVLSGLKQALEPMNDPFPRALAMMSGVSGGSVGIMHFADAYSQSEPNLLPAVKALDEYAPIRAAEASSLDHIAWGLTYPDLFWSVLTPFKGLSNASLTSDRGYALERALQRTKLLGHTFDME